MRAVLLDALGTLLELEPPAPRLRAALARRGVTIDAAAAERAMAAEIAHYRREHHRGGDAAGLATLRAECAQVAGAALGTAVTVDVLLEAIAFRAFPEVPGVLRALRARGLRLVVLSNWDRSLHEALAATGLAALVDGAIASAEIGAAKPDPRAFAAALALAGAAPHEAMMVGDTPAADVAGARAAGLHALLVDRSGGEAGALRDLSELPARVA